MTVVAIVALLDGLLASTLSAILLRQKRTLARRLDLSLRQNERLQTVSRTVMRGRSDDADRLDSDHGWTHVLEIGSRVELVNVNDEATGVHEIVSWSEGGGTASIDLEACRAEA